MYKLKITNNGNRPIGYRTSSGNRVFSVDPGQSTTLDGLGSVFISGDGLGQVSFMDLDDRKIDGYPTLGKQGVLIRAVTTEAYYQYDDAGSLSLEVDSLGCSVLSAPSGDLISISLPELTLK